MNHLGSTTDMNVRLLEEYKAYFDSQRGQKYPCSNQVVLCGIVTNDRNKAIDFMKDKVFMEKRERRNQIDWVLSNGERWTWRIWNEACKGYRFYKIVIDRNISDELFDILIHPCCGSYCCSMEII